MTFSNLLAISLFVFFRHVRHHDFIALFLLRGPASAAGAQRRIASAGRVQGFGHRLEEPGVGSHIEKTVDLVTLEVTG